MEKERLDVLLHERGLVESRERARRLILAGQVLVNGEVIDKPGTHVHTSAAVSIKEAVAYVSRGGFKLETALRSFVVDVAGMVIADVGASTGGFTDCLLQGGAARVYAIDVGYGQLAWSLRQDPRVVVLDRINVRYLQGLPEAIDLATVDVSFISLKLVLPAVRRLLKSEGQVIALIKPQFEAGRDQVRKGVVKDPAVHRAVLHDLLSWAGSQGWIVQGLVVSPLRGPAGNVEFLTHLRLPSGAPAPLARDGVPATSHTLILQMIEECLAAPLRGMKDSP
ncbi:MAG: TlyA family RNA methyltransferase [Chloroflexi bacterium]|nr:TlyA family RNA methyltransferase [Chloroflexota bacterium]